MSCGAWYSGRQQWLRPRRDATGRGRCPWGSIGGAAGWTLLCLSSLKERGRSIPTKKIVSVLCADLSVQAGSRQPADGVRVERPQHSEDERPWGRQGLTQDGGEEGAVAGVAGPPSGGRSRGGSSIASHRWPWAARARVPVIPPPRRAAWSCAAAAGRAQSNGRPRRQAGVMTHTSTRPAAPEPFTSPALAPTPGSAPGRRAGRSRPG